MVVTVMKNAFKTGSDQLISLEFQKSIPIGVKIERAEHPSVHLERSRRNLPL
jgi:hypothetical protein